MSKWNITSKGNGSFEVEEISEIGPLDFLKGLLIILVLIMILGPIILFHSWVSNTIEEKRSAREAARIDAQMAIETSVWNLDIIDSQAIYGQEDRTDSYGNTYSGEYREFCSWDGYESYTVVNISERHQYKRLTGVIFTRPEQAEDLSITFRIFADGKCIYDSGEMHRSTKAIQFDVDISGTKQLRFLASSSDFSETTNPAIILENAVLHAE